MMLKDYEKELNFNSETFDTMLEDMNFVLQRLIANMEESDTDEGSMTIKLDINMVSEGVPTADGNSRIVKKPKFIHKVTSAVKINDERKGAFNNEMELLFDEDTGTYKLTPVKDAQQMSIFDTEYQETQAPDEYVVGEGQKAIEGNSNTLLPSPEDEEMPEYEDISDELLGDGESTSDDYDYDDPEEGEE